MWEFMEKQEPTVFEKTSNGIERVSQEVGKYAYFMESSTIEYNIERRCDLTQVSDGLGCLCRLISTIVTEHGVLREVSAGG